VIGFPVIKIVRMFANIMEREKIKDLVKEKYGQVANSSSCCGSGCCGSVGCGPGNDGFTMNEDYRFVKGYEKDADLNLGCGLPTQFAGIREGDTVIDLGSGAGNDCFVARAEAGESGRIIGIDMTPEMVEKARNNASKLGFSNIEFILADIENMPVSDGFADVVISNCVLNLLPSKEKIFKEIHRVLKPGSHFCISDVVITGTLPVAIKENVELYTGCIAGAIQKDKYLEHISGAGFLDITVHKENEIGLPESYAEQYKDSFSILSVTVTGRKPE
jgi:ubiquinone/menaquinone biosynthesis C-methylase UbiE